MSHIDSFPLIPNVDGLRNYIGDDVPDYERFVQSAPTLTLPPCMLALNVSEFEELKNKIGEGLKMVNGMADGFKNRNIPEKDIENNQWWREFLLVVVQIIGDILKVAAPIIVPIVMGQT